MTIEKLIKEQKKYIINSMIHNSKKKELKFDHFFKFIFYEL